MTELSRSLLSDVDRVRSAEETRGNILTTLVVSILAPGTVRTHIVLTDPVHWSIVGGVSSVVRGPPSLGFVVVGIANLGAGVIIKEPSGVVSDHLVVVVVEEVCATRGPDISEQ